MFLYIDPLKQGLKLEMTVGYSGNGIEFLYIDPLKQGLKLSVEIVHPAPPSVFIHRSIKTRIETLSS